MLGASEVWDMLTETATGNRKWGSDPRERSEREGIRRVTLKNGPGQKQEDGGLRGSAEVAMCLPCFEGPAEVKQCARVGYPVCGVGPAEERTIVENVSGSSEHGFGVPGRSDTVFHKQNAVNRAESLRDVPRTSTLRGLAELAFGLQKHLLKHQSSCSLSGFGEA